MMFKYSYRAMSPISSARLMSRSVLVGSLALLASQAALASDDAYFTNVSASFKEMLHHAPYHGPSAMSLAVQHRDTAEEFIHAALRGELRTTQFAVAGDAAAGVVRMLDHTPYHGPSRFVAVQQRDVAADLVHSRLNDQPPHLLSVAQSGQ